LPNFATLSKQCVSPPNVGSTKSSAEATNQVDCLLMCACHHASIRVHTWPLTEAMSRL